MNIEALKETADYCNHTEYVQTNNYVCQYYIYIYAYVYAHPHAYTYYYTYTHNICRYIYNALPCTDNNIINCNVLGSCVTENLAIHVNIKITQHVWNKI